MRVSGSFPTARAVLLEPDVADGLSRHAAGRETRCDWAGCLERASKNPRALLKACSRCRATKYCSAECQKADWPSHKRACAAAEGAAAALYTGEYKAEQKRLASLGKEIQKN